jgi:hypothetical protein
MQGEIESELDRALQSLSETDRAAVVMHYFQGREFAEVGAALKTTAEAARKRTERAVAKLRMRFAQAGVELTPAAVGTALSLAGTEKAPSALPAKVIAPPSASAAAIAAAALAMMSAAKLKLAAVGAACVVAIAMVAVIVPTMGGARGTTARAVGRTVGPTTAIDDGSAARNAWIKLTEAMQAGNVAEVINSAYVTDPAYQGFFDQIVETVRLESEFKRSFRARYGDRAAKQLAYSLSHQPRAFTEGRFFPKDVPVRIDGDRAWVNVSDTEVAMVKVGGAWKLTVEWQAGLRGNETQWRRGSLLRDWPRDRPLPPELATDMARLNNEACRRAIKALDEGTLSTPAEVNRFFAQSAFQSVGVIDQRWKASTQPASTRPAAQVARRGSD